MQVLCKSFGVKYRQRLAKILPCPAQAVCKVFNAFRTVYINEEELNDTEDFSTDHHRNAGMGHPRFLEEVPGVVWQLFKRKVKDMKTKLEFTHFNYRKNKCI